MDKGGQLAANLVRAKWAFDFSLVITDHIKGIICDLPDTVQHKNTFVASPRLREEKSVRSMQASSRPGTKRGYMLVPCGLIRMTFPCLSSCSISSVKEESVVCSDLLLCKWFILSTSSSHRCSLTRIFASLIGAMPINCKYVTSIS